VTRLLRLALLAVVAILALAAPAYAHVNVIFSDPAPNSVLTTSPTSLRFVFDDEIAAAGASVLLTGPGGRAVTTSAVTDGDELTATLDTTLDEGTWLAQWRVVSYDGHPRAGNIAFSVGKVTDTPDASSRDGDPTVRRLLDGVTGIGDLALLLACGLVAVGVLVPGSATSRARLATSRARTAAMVGSVVAVMAAAAAVPLSGLYRLGFPLSRIGDGAVWSTALVGTEIATVLVLAGSLSAALVATSTGDGPLALFPAAIAVSTPAWSGHNRAADPAWLATFATVTHLAAAAIWLGGVLAIVLWWRETRGSTPHNARLDVVGRFGFVASCALIVIALEGGLLAWLTVGSWSNLVETTYGRILSVKIAVVLAAVGCAWWVRRGFDVARPTRGLRAELALLFVVPLLAGFLVNEPPEKPYDQPVIATLRSAGPLAIAPDGTLLAPASESPPRLTADGQRIKLSRDSSGNWQGRVPDDATSVSIEGRSFPIKAPEAGPPLDFDPKHYLVRRDLALAYLGSPPWAEPGDYWRFQVEHGALVSRPASVPGKWRPRDAGEPTTEARDSFVRLSLGGALKAGVVDLPVTITAADGRPMPESVRLLGALFVRTDGEAIMFGAEGDDLTGRLDSPGDGRLFVFLALGALQHSLALDVAAAE
jgi:copper transport protein